VAQIELIEPDPITEIYFEEPAGPTNTDDEPTNSTDNTVQRRNDLYGLHPKSKQQKRDGDIRFQRKAPRHLSIISQVGGDIRNLPGYAYDSKAGEGITVYVVEAGTNILHPVVSSKPLIYIRTLSNKVRNGQICQGREGGFTLRKITKGLTQITMEAV